MAIGWYITTYKRRGSRPARYCAMDDFTGAILADGGAWAETEVLGGYAVVKVRAAAGTLQTIAQAEGFQRLPVNSFTAGLSSLTDAQRAAILDRLKAMGYTAGEIQAGLGDLSTQTLAQALRFAASRRRKARYDAVADQIVLDGEIVACRAVEEVEGEVQWTVDGG